MKMKKVGYIIIFFGLILMVYVLCGVVQAFSVTKDELVRQDCNVTAFQQQLRLKSLIPVVPVHLLSRCRHVMYNRVPKCASRTMRRVISALSKQRNLTALATQSWRIPGTEFASYSQQEYLRDTQITEGDFVLTGHVHFFEFEKYYKDTTAFINIVREPLAWFESLFSFRKYGSDGTGAAAPWEFSNLSLSECVRNDACVDGLNLPQRPIHFLCGQEPVCGSDSRAALQRADDHFRNDYLLVGMSERFTEYLEVLEYLMPQIFANANSAYQEIENKAYLVTKTRKKEYLDDATAQLLKKKFEMDIVFYNEIVNKFDRMLAVTRLSRGAHPQGRMAAWAGHLFRTLSHMM